MTTSSTSTPASPITAAVAVPRLAPQRRWRPALLWLAVALIAVGGLVVWRVVTSIGTTEQYLAIARPVQIGSAVTADDLTTVRITADPALKPIPVAERDKLIGKFAAVPLVPGTLLTNDQLTTERAPGPGEQLVRIGLDQERLPTERIAPGRKLILVVTAAQNAPDQPTTTAPLRVAATAVDVQAGAKDGQVLLNVAVAERDGPMVGTRAAEGRLVVLLPAAG
ncbi:SAF domain-containing protein [Actinoplanes regularis]|uniref:SAF domain-containing protein n=1 Tax=Actinoplanes regularis TaxID=52697 RepID=UPI0024A2C71E|nr:SAF domain-containing protein [Actinoplanes regularis]GLW34476.1 hypothetical protein Areg01_74130 [Actinoplanes regularis]